MLSKFALGLSSFNLAASQPLPLLSKGIKYYRNLQRYASTASIHCEFPRLTLEQWWDEFGAMKPLHAMNAVRVPWIKNTLAQFGPEKDLDRPSLIYPLSGLRILDVGCGGGLLSEPLARLGATVTGIDSSPDAIDVAQTHAENLEPALKKQLNFVSDVSLENFAKKCAERFHAVVLSEVLEHVESDLDTFLTSCVQLLNPGGFIFITTINRTVASKILAIWVAEYALQLLPCGMHDWQKFVTPEDLQLLLSKANCSVRLINGLAYNPLTNSWRWCSNKSVNYGLLASKC